MQQLIIDQLSLIVNKLLQKSDVNDPNYKIKLQESKDKDQKKAIRDVLCDLSSKKPMDRLVCGDVGFGKSEVALRAIV